MVKKNKKSIVDKGIYFCNTIALISNFIFFIISLIYIIWYMNFNKKYMKTNAKVISISNKSDIELCIEKQKRNRKTTPKKRSFCIIEVEFIVNNNKYNVKIDTNEYSNKYLEGTIVPISYNINNHSDVILHKKHMLFKVLFYIALVILIIIVITSYLRIYHRDNKFIKWWIGIECLDNFFD